MVAVQFYPLDATYKVVNGKAQVYLFGRTIADEQVCVIDPAFEPYFYVLPKQGEDPTQDLLKLKKEQYGEIYSIVRVEPVQKNILEKQTQLFKVFTNIPKAVAALKDDVRVLSSVQSTYECDIPFVRRYFIDKGMTPLTLVTAEGDVTAEKLRVPAIRAKSIQQSTETTLAKPRILAVDIETYNPTGKHVDAEKHPIVMLALAGDNFKKVLTWKRFETTEPFVEFLPSEADVLDRFKELVEDYKPDMIVGYYSDGFDFPYIRVRATKNRIPLDIGLDYSELRIQGKKEATAQITGIAHIDILRVIRKLFAKTMKTDIFTLDAVSNELLGKNKHAINIELLATAWDNTNSGMLNEFAKYNLQDAQLTYELAQLVMPNLIEFVKIVGQLPFDVNRMGFSQLVEWYAMRQAFVLNEIAPNKPGYRAQQQRTYDRVKGGFVYEPKPGLYQDLVVFDYRSLYPSIIASHNISPGMRNCNCCEDSKQIKTDRGTFWYCQKRKGFVSGIIEDLIMRRARIKDILKKGDKDPLLVARSQALKDLANSFYGYLGFSVARWYDISCAESTTAWGRQYIMSVIERAHKEGFHVVYSDSIAGYRFIPVLTPDGILEVLTPAALFERLKTTKTAFGEKDYVLGSGYATLSVDPKTKSPVWKPIMKLIRHQTHKKLYRVNQKYGETIVTEDHSLIVEGKHDFEIVTPLQLRNKSIAKVYRIPPVKQIDEVDWYALLKDYSSISDYKGMKKQARVQADAKRLWFGWTNRKKPICIKRFIRLGTPEFDALCRLIGNYIPEGSSSTAETTQTRKGASIANSDVKRLQQLQKDYHLLFSEAKGSVIPSTKKTRTLSYKTESGTLKTTVYQDMTHKLQMMNGLAAVFFKMLCGQTSRHKRLPSFVFHSPKKYQELILAEIVAGDGYRTTDKRYANTYAERNFKYTTQSLELVSGLSVLLTQLGYHFTISYRPSKNCYSIQTSSRHNSRLATSVECVGKSGTVYDLEVADSHMFVDACGLLLLHNTDSVFLTLHGKTKEDARAFVEAVNRDLPGLMELDYENHYPAGIFVAVKTSEAGAKKKYALLNENGQLKIAGFETVRRNWSPIAKETQKKVLTLLLTERKPDQALQYIKTIVDDLKQNKLPLTSVTIHTQLSKDISEYESTGPHVAAAQRMQQLGKTVGPGTFIYFVVVRGKGRIRDKVKLPEETKQEEYDADYYIENQILPSVEKIFEVFGINIHDYFAEKTQSTLGKFF